MAKLYFYYASMNAGKSTTLLQADFNYRERGMATMLPYSIGLLLAGLAMTIGWVVLDLPLGPGASVFMDIPAAADPTAPAEAD